MRLQILHLPAPPDEYPFALVLDEVSREALSALNLAEIREEIRDEIGAKSVLIFADTVELA